MKEMVANFLLRLSLKVFLKSVKIWQSYCQRFGAWFLARDSIYEMLSPVRSSVRLSHGWISQRRLKLGSRNLHHRVAPWL